MGREHLGTETRTGSGTGLGGPVLVPFLQKVFFDDEGGRGFLKKRFFYEGGKWGQAKIDFAL